MNDFPVTHRPPTKPLGPPLPTDLVLVTVCARAPNGLLDGNFGAVTCVAR